jgi:hypothetical protein
MLLEFIAAEHDQLARANFVQHNFHESLPERPGSTSDQYGFLRPVHFPSRERG